MNLLTAHYRAVNRNLANNSFFQAQRLTNANGLKLIRREPKLYQLKGKDWVLNIRPETLKIADGGGTVRAPEVMLTEEVFSLVDVVEAVIEGGK